MSQAGVVAPSEVLSQAGVSSVVYCGRILRKRFAALCAALVRMLLVCSLMLLVRRLR